MFTGIIQTTGSVRSIEKDGDWRCIIATPMDLSRTEIGASIACSGVCLTAVDKGDDWFAVDVSHETLSKTTLGNWQEGSVINLEPSLKLGDELGGHIVSGHVDGLAVIRTIRQDGDSHVLTLGLGDEFMRFIAPKGSAALDGISLTVNEVGADYFTVNIIPHTWQHTTLGQKEEGDQLNFEIDMLARYVARMIGKDA